MARKSSAKLGIVETILHNVKWTIFFVVAGSIGIDLLLAWADSEQLLNGLQLDAASLYLKTVKELEGFK